MYEKFIGNRNLSSCHHAVFLRKAGLMLVLVLISGCNSPELLQDRRYNPPVYFGVHTVKPGDTMYSIAWRYGRDYKELARANGIPPPYHIRAGQKIRLDLKAKPEQNKAKAPVTKKNSNVTKNNKQAKANKGRIESKLKSKRFDAPLEWMWPHTGPIIARYSSTGSLNKGVDIGGKSGDSVIAAADGEVVYAGSGLRGYGKLIIISHAHDFISAYAHNRKILVREGDKVKAGQKIAELGDTEATRMMLHFEIRKNGVPVDPLKYLPARR